MIFRGCIIYEVSIKISCTYLDFLAVRVVLSLPSSVDVANGLTRHTFEGSDIFMSTFLYHMQLIIVTLSFVEARHKCIMENELFYDKNFTSLAGYECKI